MISTSSRASAVGVYSEKGQSAESTAGLRPEVVLLLAQANSGVTENLDEPFQVYSTTDLSTKAGKGSIADRNKKIIFTTNSTAKLYVALLSGDPSSGAAATATATFSGTTASDSFNINIDIAGDIKVVGVSKGDTPEEVAAKVNTIVIGNTSLLATVNTTSAVNTFTANFKGSTGNNLVLEMLDDDGEEITESLYGVGVSIVDFTGGTGATDVTTALAAIPDSVGITRIINQENNTTNLDALEEFADARATDLVAERIINYTGYAVDTSSIASVETAKGALSTLADTRANDERNSIIPTGNVGLPIDEISDIVAQRANETASKPGLPAKSKATHKYSKPRNVNWLTHAQRDDLLNDGITNIDIVDSTFRIDDLCVLYHPSNDDLQNTSQPINFYDEDITSTGNMCYALKKGFSTDEWREAKFVEEDDISTASFVKKLSEVSTTIDGYIDTWVGNGAETAFIRDAQYAKDNKVIAFNSSNTERIDTLLNMKLARTGRIYAFGLALTK